MNSSINNVKLKFFNHLLILLSVGFAFFLYSDDYDIFPWATHDDALKFLHLIMTIPIPLVIAIIINFQIQRKTKGIRISLVRLYPIICLVLISGYFFLIASSETVMLLIDETVRLRAGFIITGLLLSLEMYLLIYDMRAN